MLDSTFSSMMSVFSLLVFAHFFSDWTFQTHDEAMRKSKEPLVLLRHCLYYSIMMWIVCNYLGAPRDRTFAIFATLLASHIVIDTYIPVLAWVKYVRQAPEFYRKSMFDQDAIKQFVEKPIGMILLITMDQLLHIAFLLPTAWLVTHR